MRTFTIYLFAMMLVAFVLASPTQADNPQMVDITSPSMQDTISEVTTIVGSVNFEEFLRYELYLNTGDELIWAASGFAPVTNGNLARIDPRVFADGSYQLVLRQVRTNSNYTDYAGPLIRIDNPHDAPLAYYPEVEPSFLYKQDGRAVARLLNCHSNEIVFDYHSATGSDSETTFTVPGKQADTICPFYDLLLKPTQYSGTINEAGLHSKGFSFTAKSGKAYELQYNGIDAGDFALIINEVEGDSVTPASDSDAMMTTHSMEIATTTDASTKIVAENHAEIPADSEDVLPASGGQLAQNGPYLAIAMAFLLFIIVAGSFAARRRRFM